MLITYGFASYAQENAAQEWQLLKETNGVNCYYLVTSCDSKKVVFLKIINGTSTNKNVIWGVNINGSERGPATMPTYFLEAGKEITSDCTNDGPLKTVFVDDHFSISDLIVNLIIMP